LFSDDQLLPISALQHLLFCERQCALIYLERVWAENRLTVEGRQLHKKAHDPRKGSGDVRHGGRTVRGIELLSRRLGLFGVADVVEFPPCSPTGERSGPPLLIEYKRGRPKKHDADRVQLCAQAMCLEEMLEPNHSPGWIPVGAIFYGQTRRRLDVPLGAELRDKTRDASVHLHDLIAGQVTPSARREKKCDRCSLLHLCLPDALRPRRTPRVYLEQAAIEMLAVS
jgi:CRISPR-associated exonuclease Cas4